MYILCFFSETLTENLSISNSNMENSKVEYTTV